MPERDELAEDLQRILSGEAPLRFCFQPIADLQRGSVAGYEMLARLPTRSNLPPDLCLQAAGRMGIRSALEERIVRETLDFGTRMPPNTFLSVNVSPSFLLSEAWAGLIRELDSLGGTVIEITEEDLIVDYDRIRNCVAAIRAKDGSIAIDDTGAGYASLKHILELRPDFVKLDRALVQGCDSDRAKSVVIETIGNAVDRMDAWVIAEGVETEGELSELLRLGIPLAQGYFCGRPEWLFESLSTPSVACIQNFRVNRKENSELLLLNEPCPTATSVAGAEALLAAEPECRAAIVVDQWHRPVSLLERHDGSELRGRSDIMRCQKNCSLQEALQRALTRPVNLRFDPVVLIDHRGKLVGLVRVDRLMCAVIAPVASAGQHRTN